MSLPPEKYYTVEDFYNMPEDIRAELINGQIVYMAAPSTQHQIISGELYIAIANYIKSKGGKCRVLAAPYSVQLRKAAASFSILAAFFIFPSMELLTYISYKIWYKLLFCNLIISVKWYIYGFFIMY